MSRQPRLPFDVPIPKELQEWADIWIKYKAERRESYKSIGLAVLIDQMTEWGPERTAAAVKHSIACNYSGLFEPPAATRRKAAPRDEYKAAYYVSPARRAQIAEEYEEWLAGLTPEEREKIEGWP